MPTLTFDEAWRHAVDISGWLTEAQARVLHEEASRIAPGRVVEIGSHLGRSTVVLASSGAVVTAIDPFPASWKYGRDDTETTFRRHLSAAAVDDAVDVRVSTSRAVRDTWSEPIRLVYVDGKHDMWSCLDDLRWATHLSTGDRVLVHDAFSSLGVTLAMLRALVLGHEFTMIDRTGSLARLQLGRPTLRDRIAVLAHVPWFLRNLGVKVLLRLHLTPIARALGHHDTADPY